MTNWVFISDGTTYTDVLAGASPLRHVWLLAIEEQLYMILALGVVAAATIGSPGSVRRRFAVGAGILGVASAGWMAWLSLGGAPTERTYRHRHAVHAMLVGAVLGAVLLGRPMADRPTARRAGSSDRVLVVVVLLGERTPMAPSRAIPDLASAAAAPRSQHLSPDDRTASRLAVVVVGAISYGLYLCTGRCS